MASGRGAVRHHEDSGITLADSTLAWGNIVKHGLAVPFSTMEIPFTSVIGIKSDFNHESQVKIWQFDSWFRSVHALFLVSSSGFLQGAVHCLNTLEHRDIQLFAAAIMIADQEATLASHVALWTSAGFIFKLIGKAIAYIPFPERFLATLANLRMTKTQLVFGSLIVVPIAVDNLFDYIRSLEESRDLAASMLNPDSEFHKQSKKSVRTLLMATAVQEFHKEWKGESEQEFHEFTAWVQQNINKDILAAAHQDFAQISQSSSPDDLKYQKILKVILPILDQIVK